MITLKKYLIDNGITTTIEERQELGLLIAKQSKTKNYKMEDNLNIRVYDCLFLGSDLISSIIINFLNKN